MVSFQRFRLLVIAEKLPVYLILICLFAATGGLIADLKAAEIIYVAGSVQVQGQADKAWKKAEAAMKLNIGDSVRTAGNSKADIALDDAKTNILRIDPKTLVVLSSTQSDLINRLDLSNGRLYAKIESVKSGLTFEVNTPSATIGVRGTGFSVVSEAKADEVAVYESDVFVRTFDAQRNLISEISLPEGFKAAIERFEAPGDLIPASPAELKRWDAIKQELSRHIEESAKKTDPVERVSEQVKTIENINEAKELIKEEGADQRPDRTQDESLQDTHSE